MKAKGQPPGVRSRGSSQWEEWGCRGNGNHPPYTTSKASILMGSFSNQSPLDGHGHYFHVLSKPWFSSLVEGEAAMFSVSTAEVFKLNEIYFLDFFSFVGCAFGVSKKSSPNPKSPRFSPVLYSRSFIVFALY